MYLICHHICIYFTDYYRSFDYRTTVRIIIFSADNYQRMMIDSQVQGFHYTL